MQNVKAYEVIDHGAEHAQYFQGCGISGTEYEHVATGCGSTARKALEDALDQIHDAASATLDRILKEQCDANSHADDDCHLACESTCANCSEKVHLRADGTWEHYATGECDDADGGADHEECEKHHYVSVRYTITPVVVRLDNEGSDPGNVTVMCDDQEAADHDQTIDGSSWETPSDMTEAYTILSDRMG